MAPRIELKDHILLGLQMHNTSTGKIYNIVKVYKNWHLGWYLTALLEKNGTYRVCFIENISSHGRSILRTIEQHQEIFEVL